MNIYTTSNSIAINNQSRFISKKISALLFSLICVLTLAACAGANTPEGEPNPPTGISVLDLRIIPDETNATLIWDNPDVNITQININYRNITADSFEEQINITDGGDILPNATVTEMITGLTNGTTYMFNVRLELGGADENRTVNRELSMMRLIGPNLDQDEYADADRLELDEDGDGVNDNLDAFPRNTTLSAFMVTELSARPGNGEVTLNWNNPDADIASISISYQRDDFVGPLMMDSSTQIASGAPNIEETIEGLTNGQSYTFNVTLTLTGDDADKKVAVASTTATPGTFSVTDLTAVPNGRSVILSWNNPDANIASISISYEREDSMGTTMMKSSTQITPGAENVKETITDLMNGVSYTFTVSLALTGDDTGREGEAPSVTTIPDTFSVIGLQSTPGNRSVTLSWNNPVAEIASISISYQRDDFVGPLMMDSSTQIASGAPNVEETIEGLTNGQSYTFNVTLTLTGDDAGKRVVVASTTAIPGTFSVIGLTATPGNNNATLSWINPDADIASISMSYGITDSGVSATVGASNTGRNASVKQTIMDLTNGVSYTFTVSLTLRGDDAGKEGVPQSVTVAIGPNLDGDEYADFVDNDIDGDSFINADDVDDDGDGLIEISTATQLDQIRYNLLGSSLNTSDGVADDASGCGAPLSGISECNGYELTQNISLDGYNGDNWEPIGSCGNLEGASQTVCTTASSLFSTTFDGNGWTISNLTITNPAAPYNNGAGLFGAISPDSILRNVHLRSANISQDGTNVGLLVGYAQGARISNSSAEGEVMATGRDVGGLVGDGVGANITSSYVTGGSISGFSGVGGLIGAGDFAMITSSYAMDITVLSENSNTGGLIGTGNTAMITSSYVVGGSVMGLDRVGGMTGSGNGINITLSYVADLSVSGRDNIGGMVGSSNGIITSSYVGGGVAINGTNRNNIGGMIGSGNGATIKSSYSTADTISGTGSVGGMVGFGTLNDASSSSYWNNETSGITGGSVADKSEGKTTDELQMPTDFADSIYATWATDICDDGSRAWDLGLNDQYPALNCTPGGKDAQRP